MIEEIIKSEIREKGYITLGRFMELSLYHPEYGYYMTRDPFGMAGDFTTASEISQMFGEIIGLWVADIWRQMGKPTRFNLVELGPGRGTLMRDMVRVTDRVDGFTDSVQKWFMECSPFLKEIQEKTCADIGIRWIEALSQIDNDDPCIMIGNEFMDALPIDQFSRKYGRYMQKIVVENGVEFTFDEIEIPEEVVPVYYKEFGSFVEQFEFSKAQKRFMDICCQRLKKTSGAALLIDYGYIRESVKIDTVQAVKAHKFSEILADIGETDLTAHVNFGWLRHEIKKHGVDWHGVAEQGAFLKELGLNQRAESLKNAASSKDNVQQIISDIDLAVERLAGRKGMGHLFKVACFSSGIHLRPAGFSTSSGT